MYKVADFSDRAIMQKRKQGGKSHSHNCQICIERGCCSFCI